MGLVLIVQAHNKKGEHAYMNTVTRNYAVDELILFTDNNYQAYEHKQNTYILLDKKHEKGVYDKAKAYKAFCNLANTMAQLYAKHFGEVEKWYIIFAPEERRAVAQYWLEEYEEERECGNA